MSKILLLILTVLAGYAYADPLAINQQTHATTTITNGTRTHTILPGDGKSNRRSHYDQNRVSSINSVTQEMELVDEDSDPLTDPTPVWTNNWIGEYAYEERSFTDATEYTQSTYDSHYSSDYDSVEFRISNGQIGSISGISSEDGRIDGNSTSSTTGSMGDIDAGTGGEGYEENGFGVFGDVASADSLALGGPYFGEANFPTVPDGNYSYSDKSSDFAETWSEPSEGSFGHNEKTDTVYSSLYLNPYTR